MVSLREAVYREAVIRRDTDVVDALLKVIEQAVGLFHLGPYTFYLEDVGYGSVRKFTVEAPGLPNHPFRHQLNMYLLAQSYNPHAYLYQTLREPLFNHFRYRPGIEPDDHIILGEE